MPSSTLVLTISLSLWSVILHNEFIIFPCCCRQFLWPFSHIQINCTSCLLIFEESSDAYWWFRTAFYWQSFFSKTMLLDFTMEVKINERYIGSAIGVIFYWDKPSEIKGSIAVIFRMFTSNNINKHWDFFFSFFGTSFWSSELSQALSKESCISIYNSLLHQFC